jgi:hypothetical protein
MTINQFISNCREEAVGLWATVGITSFLSGIIGYVLGRVF